VKAARRRFGSSPSERGRATHGGAWRAGRGGGGSGVLRKKKEGVGWAMGWSGRVDRMPLGPARRENNEESGLGCKDDWTKIENWLQI
jgi:hypothetical protein